MTQHQDIDALDKLIDAVGVEEWGADTVKNEGEYGPGEDAVSGFDSYCVIDSKGNTLLDTLNFDQSEIHEEYDDDYFRAWDEPARKVAEFVAAFNPQTARTLIDRLRKAEAATVPVAAFDRLSALNESNAARILELEEQAEAASKWQPIETAPKDGSHVLAMLPDSDTCYVIEWADASKFIRVAAGGGIGWHIAWDGYYLAPHEQPTHWQPLPAAPDSTPTDSEGDAA